MKDGSGEVYVEPEDKIVEEGDWKKVRKLPGKMSEEELKPQHLKVIEAGKETAKRCKGKKGSDFKTCQSMVLNEIFPNRKK